MTLIHNDPYTLDLLIRIQNALKDVDEHGVNQFEKRLNWNLKAMVEKYKQGKRTFGYVNNVKGALAEYASGKVIKGTNCIQQVVHLLNHAGIDLVTIEKVGDKDVVHACEVKYVGEGTSLSEVNFGKYVNKKIPNPAGEKMFAFIPNYVTKSVDSKYLKTVQDCLAGTPPSMVFDIHLHGPGADRVAGELATSLKTAWKGVETGNSFRIPILIEDKGIRVQKEIEVVITVIKET